MKSSESGPPALQLIEEATHLLRTSLGALTLYRDRPGPLNHAQHTDALLFADTAAEVIIEMQAAAGPGALGAEAEPATNFRFVVHQAAGMVSVQLDITVADALIRLRAHGFATGRLVTDVAEDVVARRLQTAQVELAAQGEFDEVVVNQDVERTAADLVSLIHRLEGP